MLWRCKIGKIILAVIITTLTVAILIAAGLGIYFLSLVGGRDNRVRPWEIADHWVCTDPDFEIQYTYDKSGKRTTEATLIWEGEQIETGITFRGGVVTVYRSKLHPSPKATTDRLFEGSWRYESGNLIMVIRADYCFDGAYRELVFVPQ